MAVSASIGPMAGPPRDDTPAIPLTAVLGLFGVTSEVQVSGGSARARLVAVYRCCSLMVGDALTSAPARTLNKRIESRSQEVELRLAGAERATRVELEDDLPADIADGGHDAFRCKLLHQLTRMVESVRRPDGRRLVFAEVPLRPGHRA